MFKLFKSYHTTSYELISHHICHVLAHNAVWWFVILSSWFTVGFPWKLPHSMDPIDEQFAFSSRVNLDSRKTGWIPELPESACRSLAGSISFWWLKKRGKSCKHPKKDRWLNPLQMLQDLWDQSQTRRRVWFLSNVLKVAARNWLEHVATSLRLMPGFVFRGVKQITAAKI